MSPIFADERPHAHAKSGNGAKNVNKVGKNKSWQQGLQICYLLFVIFFQASSYKDFLPSISIFFPDSQPPFSPDLIPADWGVKAAAQECLKSLLSGGKGDSVARKKGSIVLVVLGESSNSAAENFAQALRCECHTLASGLKPLEVCVKVLPQGGWNTFFIDKAPCQIPPKADVIITNR